MVGFIIEGCMLCHSHSYYLSVAKRYGFKGKPLKPPWFHCYIVSLYSVMFNNLKYLSLPRMLNSWSHSPILSLYYTIYRKPTSMVVTWYRLHRGLASPVSLTPRQVPLSLLTSTQSGSSCRLQLKKERLVSTLLSSSTAMWKRWVWSAYHIVIYNMYTTFESSCWSSQTKLHN